VQPSIDKLTVPKAATACDVNITLFCFEYDTKCFTLMGQDGECALKRTVSWDSQQEGAQTGLPLGRHIKCMEQF